MRAGVLWAAFVLAASGPAAAQGYPYPADDIAQELGMTQQRLSDWWSKAPEKLRANLSAQPLAKWGPTVVCDYLGFRAGTAEGDACRDERYRARMSTADRWNPDGTYRGPSEECLARNKTDEWGRLVCD